MATLRDMGLEPRTFDSAPVLRDAGLVPRAAPDVTELVDQASANSMGQLRRGFSTGLLNADANAMAADESSLRAQGRSEEADGLRSRIGALQQRALTFAPKEQDVTQLNWEPGRVLDYGLGAVGQGAASMLEPAGAAVGLAAAGRVLGAIPTAPTRLLGGALRLGAPAAAGYLNFRQGKGEFYNDAAEDPTIMAGKTAEEINQSANLSGALSGVIDTAFPAVAAERIAGRAGMKALAKAGMPAKIGLDLAGEGATEVGQGEIKRHLLTDANPLRDTSGDTADRWNDFVGGILGAGPLSAASHLASKGHARLGVADDPNNDVSGKGTTDKAEPKAGDSFSDVLRRGTSERKARAGSDAEVKAWKDTLEGLGSDDPLEGATLQHAALVKELSGRVAKGEAGAQEHLDAVSAENPDDPLQMAEPAARDAAAKYLIGDGSDEEAIKKVMKAYEGRKLNTQVDYGDLGGRTGAGEPIAQNDPARAESIARYREMGQRARLTADVLTKALPEAKKKYAKVAASLGQELAHFSGEGYEKPSAGDTARVLRMGAQLVHLYGGEKAHALVTEAGRTANIEGTKLFKALNASVSVAREDVGAYQKAAATSREAAADQLVRALPPDAELRLRKDGHDLTDPGTREHLLGMVEDVFDGTGMSEKALREAIGDKAFEAVREVVGQPIEPRKKTDKQTEETVDATDTPETKTPTESDEDTGDAGLEDGDTWAQEGAKKNVEKAPGSKVYFSRGLEHGIGATDGHPFKADKKTGKLPWLSRADDRLKMKTDKAGERTGPNTLDDMMAKAYESLGGTYGKIVSETKRPTKERDQYGMLRNRRVRENIVPGEVKADDDTAPLGVGAHRIRTISAKEAMDDHKVGKDERVDLMREYAARMGEGRKTLPKDDPTIMQLRTTERRITKLEKAEPKELVTGVSKAGAATKPNPKRAELDALKSQHAEAIAELARKVGVEPKEGMTVADVADAYFSDHFMVVAEHMAEKDQLRLEPAEVTAMIRRGNNDLDYAQQFEAAGTREKVEADMNLIRFKSDKAVSGDGIAVIRASALVKWVRDNRNEFNKRETNTSTSTAIDFRNDLMEGIGALAAGGYMPHLPYMVNAVGKKESFGNGFPPSLKLETTTQAKLNKGRDMRVKDRLENGDPEIEGPVDQEAVAREQTAEPASDRNTDADELLPEGRERKRLKINPEETAYGARLKPKGGQLDLPGVTPSEFPEGARYWDAPSAPASEAATPTNPAADERKFVGPQPQSKERRRYPVAPETVDTRSAHEGRVASELEPRKQRQGAVPIDRTELAMRNAVQDAALDKVDTLTPSNAMRKGTELAASIWGAFRTDPREAFLRLQRVANALSAEAYPDPQSNEPAGGKHYAAALAPILTPFRIDKLVTSAKNPTKARATLEAMRTQTAAAIATAGDEIASGDKLKLARMLMGDPNASISAARKYLGETQRMTVKAEPAAKAAPKVEAVRKLNTQLNPAAHLSATVQAVAQTRSLMRLLGFKSAPAQFASVAEKLLTDPTQNPDAFIKESAQALSHLLVRTDAVKAAMKGVAWAQERTRLIAKLTGQGMGRIAAQEAAFQTLVGEVLAEELKARTAAERASAGTIFGAAKSFVSAFKRMATTNEFTEVVRAELNKLIEKAHNPERLKEGFAKVTFQAAVDADPQAAAVLAHMAANPKAVLTGSIVLSLSGSVYRNAANMLHDLDFVMEGTHAEALAHLNKAFPNSVQVNGFAGSQGTIYTHIVPAPGAKIVGMTYKSGKATYTVERDGQVVGRSWHDADGEHKEGEAATTVDFFVGTDQEAVGVVPFKAGGKQHNVRVTSAASIFDKKMEMGRPKDMLDYVRYVPEAGRKLNTQATPAGIQSSENAAPNDDQIAAAHAYIKKVLGPKVKVEFAKDFDAAGEWVEADNLIKLALHSGPGMLTVAHHESMHALWSQLVKNSPDAASKLAHVLSSPDIRTRLEDLLHNEPTALAQLSDPEERVAYAYQFWAAGALDVDKPATTLFAKFRKFLRKVFGMVRDSETALDIMTAFHDGKLAEPSAAGRVIEGIMAREKWNEDVRRKFDATIQHVYSSVNVSNKVLRSSESADARSLGEELFSNPGEERDGQNFEGYLNARTRVVRQYTNFLYKGVKGLSQRDLEAVAEHMQLKTPLEGIHYAPVREAVKGMRALTKRYYTYATKDAGLQLEYLGDDHYPRVWDLSELVNNREKFVAMLLQPKYAKTMRSALDMVNANKNAPQKTMEDLAAMMHEELMQKNGVDEKGMETERGGNEVLSPFFASQKERSFKWLDDEDVEPFLEKDLIGAMSRYLHQGIRAAEYSRRFGNGGAALRERLAMIGDEWVNPETGRLENRTKPGRIQGELIAAAEERGITGVEADKWVARRMEDIKNSVTAHEGSLGSEISPAVRKITSAAMAYQNLRLLPLSLFAAFADPLSIAARGPGVKAGFEAFTNGLRDVWLRWKDAASDMPAERRRSMWDDMAETAGVVDSHMFLEQMGKAHTSEFMTDFARKANRALFMANGLTAWDRSMRVTATKFAALFLQDHKSLPDKHSARWLAELGLKPEDIPLDADGKLIYDRHTLAASRYSADMNADEKAAVLAQATQEIEKVHYALTRWVEGAVLTPNAAQRPTWGSDPRWAVLFHLKQFTYSFQDTVIKRAFNEASHGNMNPIGALAASVPTMMVSDILKGFVMGGGSMPAYMKTWGLGDHMMHAVSRAGLAGTSQFGLDALRDPASLFGPTVEQAIKVVTSPSEIGKNLVDAIPGARFLGPAKDLGRAMSD